MKNQFGIVLLIIGIGLLVWGFNLSGSFSSNLSRTFTGSPTDKTIIVFIAGGICAALGLYQLMINKR
jgi:hypothetical protein